MPAKKRAAKKRKPSRARDLTPLSGGELDVARLGRRGVKPAHERTASEDRDLVNWTKASELPQFQRLVADKARFIAPATLFFIVYYFALPVSVGYFPDLMTRKVWGAVNVAYLFALSQFFMAWILAALYVRAANRFDAQAGHVAMLAFKKAKGGRS